MVVMKVRDLTKTMGSHLSRDAMRAWMQQKLNEKMIQKVTSPCGKGESELLRLWGR